MSPLDPGVKLALPWPVLPPLTQYLQLLSPMHNPALRSQARTEPASPIPLQHDASILDWLEGTGRLLARDTNENTFTENEEEISDLMGTDDGDFDDDDDIIDLDD